MVTIGLIVCLCLFVWLVCSFYGCFSCFICFCVFDCLLAVQVMLLELVVIVY